MIKINLICVGRLKEKYFAEACKEYEKRLGRYCSLTVIEIGEYRLPQSLSRENIRAALEKEASAIRARIPRGSKVIAMCSEGEKCDSVEFSGIIMSSPVQGFPCLTFLIGGSHGLDEGLKRAADMRLSMSDMTFAHHLARVMLLEQIYRSFKIAEGSGYHK
jgi:23S rRNA (pseudouridine1915-N3)-methyltransferase